MSQWQTAIKGPGRKGADGKRDREQSSCLVHYFLVSKNEASGQYYNVITSSHQLSTTAESLMITVVGDCCKGITLSGHTKI